MNSFLEEIEKYARDIEYPYKSISINTLSLPDIMYEIIWNIIGYNKSYDNFRLENILILFNDNYEACLSILNPIKKQVYVIKQEQQHFTVQNAIFIKEKDFLYDIRKRYDKHYFSALSKLPLNERKFIKNSSEKENMFVNEMLTSLNKIKQYLYWTKLQKSIMEDYKYKERIRFESNEIDNDANIKTEYQKTTIPEAHERKHDIVSFLKRHDVSSKYKPDYDFFATEENSQEVYYVKVFLNRARKCKIIMEPKNATKYTLVKHIDSAKLNEQEVKKIAIDTLKLTNKQITDAKDITRHTNTSIEDYKKLLKFLLEDINDVNPNTAKRIKEAENNAKRTF